ncbi:hypothetical protein N7492_010013 [Penicillium capsulatum]|uniref:Non-structural maintenance of chromosomes element 1 homolog n=1 Tax=Penicillium capsulatum TaxID=69766 RepID=A0A9W9LER4_9EURO|nr:hypothetical protein N7492_010013 [Penicillium capsulatum]KAJ6112521.1 hypothetical protein N7512_007845 [Penicillium capsulatum]
METDGYNDGNRAFIQAFMGHSFMTFEETQPVLAAIISAQAGSTENRSVDPDDITQEHLAAFISAANSAVSRFDLEIRSSLHQTPKNPDSDAPDTAPARVYALVNTISDPLTQLATTYTADEIAFVKRILDFMFSTNNTRLCEGMVILSTQAIQLGRASSGDANRRRSGNAESQQTQGGVANSLNMKQAEAMLQQLLEEGWLEKSRKGYYSLTPRALMELRGWLVSTYNDAITPNRIKFCNACGDIMTAGQRCGERDCKGRLHDHCIRNFFRVQQAEQCPVCKREWPGDCFVGERAVTSNRRPNPNLAQPSAEPPSASNGPASGSDESSDGGEESESNDASGMAEG